MTIFLSLLYKMCCCVVWFGWVPFQACDSKAFSLFPLIHLPNLFTLHNYYKISVQAFALQNKLCFTILEFSVAGLSLSLGGLLKLVELNFPAGSQATYREAPLLLEHFKRCSLPILK